MRCTRLVPSAVLIGNRIMEPIFLGLVFAIMWLSSSLLADVLENMRAAERRLALCPAHAR
jgi:hypothetical protein